MKYKIISIFVFFLIINFNLFSQGVWNIKYIAIDSLSETSINKEIRIDFKSSNTDILMYKMIKPYIEPYIVRDLLSKNDKVELTVDSQQLVFIENWLIFDDHGVFGDQTLVSINEFNDEKLIIKEMFLESIDNLSLTLSVTINLTSDFEKNIHSKKGVRIIINKSQIKGILLKFKD
ncbi:hypothetical protein GOQ30_09930 [Flavobacterium sp. TP390]|uniref:Uncharacterized protein n=1 Tax=Flavobacterium profundi TaxID=1774945 RepID=A0A6I4IIF0_9FLAO|nr:hypothetical protein [Flavobacterium profundi]MVO09475.1 hypothetical protein [Flavobacterium profundi]